MGKLVISSVANGKVESAPNRLSPPGPPPVPVRAAPVIAKPPPVPGPTVPLAVPLETQSESALAFDAPGEKSLSRRQRKRARNRGMGRYVFLAFLTLLCIGAGVAGVVALRTLLPTGQEEVNDHAATGNFQIKLPRGWRRSHPAEERMGVPIVASQKSPAASCALFFRDYTTRAPTQAELLDVALTKLRGYFRTVQYKNPFDGSQREPAGSLGGEPAWIVEFQATEAGDAGMSYSGQVYLMRARGYGYWLFTWGPGERELLEPHWAKVRQGFRLLQGRPGWKEKPRETVPFQGTLARYHLEFFKDLWTVERDPLAYDSNAELVLRGFEKDREGAANKAAILQVLVLPKEPDLQSAKAAAHKHLLKKQQESVPAASLGPILDPKTNRPEMDGPTELGAFRGHLSKLVLKQDRDHERFALIAVVRMEEGSLVLFGECPWDRREYWDNEFRHVFDHLAKTRSIMNRQGPKEKPKKD
jgi:hypothetical protein